MGEGLKEGYFVNMNLKRFKYNMYGGASKINTPVSKVPILFEMSFDGGKTIATFKLGTTVNHMGGYGNGHYVAHDFNVTMDVTCFDDTKRRPEKMDKRICCIYCNNTGKYRKSNLRKKRRYVSKTRGIEIRKLVPPLGLNPKCIQCNGIKEIAALRGSYMLLYKITKVRDTTDLERRYYDS